MRRTVLTGAIAIAPFLAMTPAAFASAAPAAGTFRAISVPGAVVTEPNDINDTGVIVGCFFGRRPPEHGFIDARGKFTTLNDPAAGRGAPVTACPQSVNDHGLVVGFFTASGGNNHGLRYSGGIFSTINAPGAGGGNGQGTQATSVNDSGTIVGFIVDSRSVLHGFVLRGSTFSAVNDPHAGRSRLQGTIATGITNTGTVVGTYIDSKGVQHGFTERAGRFTTINHPGTANQAGKGTFVGCTSRTSGELTGSFWPRSAPRNPSGFTLQRGRFSTLNDPTARMGTAPSCANDLGRVVGVYFAARGVPHGFEFVPR